VLRGDKQGFDLIVGKDVGCSSVAGLFGLGTAAATGFSRYVLENDYLGLVDSRNCLYS